MFVRVVITFGYVMYFVVVFTVWAPLKLIMLWLRA